MFSAGDRVKNVPTHTSAVPAGCLGTVIDAMCTYGVTVLWDGVEFHDTHGEGGWRPYWNTAELEHVDPRKHAVYDPCEKCGKRAPVFTGIPGRVMGGIWVAGAEVIECKCGHRRYYKTRG